jgi:hypothetical protein
VYITRTRKPEPGYLNLSIIGLLVGALPSLSERREKKLFEK